MGKDSSADTCLAQGKTQKKVQRDKEEGEDEKSISWRLRIRLYKCTGQENEILVHVSLVQIKLFGNGFGSTENRSLLFINKTKQALKSLLMGDSPTLIVLQVETSCQETPKKFPGISEQGKRGNCGIQLDICQGLGIFS